jgi:hypothetical protein
MRHRNASSRQMMFIVEEYMQAHGVASMADVDMDDFAQWAWNNHKWSVPQIDPVASIRRQVSRALRDTFELDQQQRLVRIYHHIRIEDPETHDPIDRWIDIRTAEPQQMQLSFAVRRGAVLNDVRQLRTDVDSYNDNNQFGATLQMDFDFNKDLEEEMLPGEYPTEPPDDEA